MNSQNYEKIGYCYNLNLLTTCTKCEVLIPSLSQKRIICMNLDFVIRAHLSLSECIQHKAGIHLGGKSRWFKGERGAGFGQTTEYKHGGLHISYLNLVCKSYKGSFF